MACRPGKNIQDIRGEKRTIFKMVSNSQKIICSALGGPYIVRMNHVRFSQKASGTSSFKYTLIFGRIMNVEIFRCYRPGHVNSKDLPENTIRRICKIYFQASCNEMLIIRE